MVLSSRVIGRDVKLPTYLCEVPNLMWGELGVCLKSIICLHGMQTDSAILEQLVVIQPFNKSTEGPLLLSEEPVLST